MMTEFKRTGARILHCSHGWTWQVELTGPEDGTARISQWHANQADSEISIQIPAADLPFVAFWLYGSYSADEWPPTRRLSDESILSMNPNPQPELRIVARRQLSRSLRGNEIVAEFTLYEEDLEPLVNWLNEASSEFGVDFESHRRRRMSELRLKPSPSDQSLVVVEPRPVPQETAEDTELVVDHQDDADSDAEPTIPVTWVRKAMKEVTGTLLLVPLIALGYWEFRTGWRDPETHQQMVGGLVMWGLLILWGLLMNIRLRTDNPRWPLRNRVD